MGPERDIRVWHFQKGEGQCTEHGQRHRAGKDDEGIAEAVELNRQDQKDQNDGQREGRKELVALDPELARLTGVVDNIALGQNSGGFIIEKTQGLIERPEAHAGDFNCIELLESVQRTRYGGVSDRGDRAERDELVARSGDVNIFELPRIETVDAFDLRYNFVTTAGDVEAVDEIAADHRSDVGTDPLKVEA